jgi:septum formation protein
MKNADNEIILASASPRRKRLLTRIGVEFQVMPSGIDESPTNGESPEDHVRRLAVEKGKDIAAKVDSGFIISADTIVAIDGTILGKPENEDDACRMLGIISGRTHEVYTGYAVIRASDNSVMKTNTVRSHVKIRELEPDEIRDYVDSREPMDKAGAYAVQGIGAGIVESVNGSYTNVVGLPLCELAQDLKELGIFDFLKANRKYDRR